MSLEQLNLVAFGVTLYAFLDQLLIGNKIWAGIFFILSIVNMIHGFGLLR